MMITMSQTLLKGTFNLIKFEREVSEAESLSDLPELEYTIGEGETLDYLFDTLVTFRPLHGNKSIELIFKGERGRNRNLKGKTNLAGRILYLDIDWLQNSEGISADVRSAINEAIRKKHELNAQMAQSRP